MLYERAVAEVERLRSALGASDMALQAARSDAARWRLAASTPHPEGRGPVDGASPADGASRPVPATMQPRRHGGADDAGAAPGAGGAVGVRTIVLREPRSLVDLFG